MDPEKTGRFIAERRKRKNMTQLELANRLHVTDRAVSKWECGRSMPDTSIMLELCKALEISVNELLTGEELEMENYNTQAEQNLLNLTKQKEQSDKQLLNMEIVIGVVGVLFLITTFAFGIGGYTYLSLPLWAMILAMVFGVMMFLVTMFFALIIEQKAGYYECKECHARYVPSLVAVIFAPHMGRSRYMKCPHCGKRSYHKKVLSQQEERLSD